MEEKNSNSNPEEMSLNDSQILTLSPKKKLPALSIETNSGSVRKVRKVGKTTEEISPTGSNTLHHKAKRPSKLQEQESNMESMTVSMMSLPKISEPEDFEKESPISPTKAAQLNFSTVPPPTLSALVIEDKNRLSISNLSVIDLKPEGIIDESEVPHVEEIDATLDLGVTLEFPQEIRKKKSNGRESKATNENIKTTQARKVKPVEQAIKLIPANKIIKSASNEIRQAPTIISTEELNVNKSESSSSSSSESEKSEHPSFNAKKYELQQKSPKRPEIMKSSIKNKRNTTESQTISDKLKSIRSNDGVPYVGLVKDVRTRAIKIENDRAELGWFAIKYNRFQKNTIFAIENGKKTISLWESTIRKLEGKFGTGVGSFFRLLRWLVIINFMTAVLYSFAFIPAISKPPRTFDDSSFYASFPIRIKFSDADIVDSAPVLIVLMVLFFIFSITQLIRRLRDEFLKDSNFAAEDNYSFSTAAFTSWNFGTKGKEASLNQYFAISNVFRTLITAEEIEQKKKEYKNKYFLARRVSGIAISALLIGISGYLIFLSTLSYDINDDTTKSWRAIIDPIKLIFIKNKEETSKDTPVLIAILNLMLPPMFEIIAKIMTFADPVTEQAFAIFLSFFAKMGGLFVVLITSRDVGGNPCKALFDNYQQSEEIYKKPPHDFMKISDATTSNCWEYQLGYTMVILLALELGITCITTIGIALFKKFVFKRYQFEMNKNILELAYRQSIVWIGTALAPGVIYMSLAGYFIVFWIKTIVLRSLGSPPRRIYNAHKQTMYFLLSLLAAFFVVIVPFIYGFVLKKPGYCGPAYSPTEQDRNFCYQLYGNRLDSSKDYCLFAVDDSQRHIKFDISEKSMICTDSTNTTKFISGNKYTTSLIFLNEISKPLKKRDDNLMTAYYNDNKEYWAETYGTYNATFNSESTGSADIIAKYSENSDNINALKPLYEFLLKPLILLVAILCMGVWVYYLKALAIKRNRRVNDLFVELLNERDEKRHLLKKLRKKGL